MKSSGYSSNDYSRLAIVFSGTWRFLADLLFNPATIIIGKRCSGAEVNDSQETFDLQ